jgi:dTDP-4-amino-4,6-dideoxygalactose transaminase
MIPCAHPKAQYLAHREAIDAAMRRVLEGGAYILGDEVRAFEAAFAAFTGVPHAVGVASGTDALHLALRAFGIGPGDEVVTTAHTAVATVAAISQVGAVPVLVDIDPDTFTIDPAGAERAVTPRTRALVPVHLYGRPADMDPLLALAARHDLRVIEDCAQAHGALYKGRRVGSLGDAGCFSFYPTKNLGALGDGGLITARDPALAERCRLLREYGWAGDGVSRVPGFNSRLDALQAAVLGAKLPHLDADNAARAAIAARYAAGLEGCGVTLPRAAEEGGHVHHLYVIRSGERDALRAFLADRGIEARVHYPVPVHRQPAYRDGHRNSNAVSNALPETERAAREVLSLPMYPELRTEEAGAVIAALRAFASGR